MWRETAEIYRSSKKKVDINWFTEWIARPPAAAFVYLLKGTRITPNQVTFLSLFIATAAGAMYVFLPGWLALIAATAVLEFSFVFDCVDGMLSRVRKTSSVLGHLLDFLMDEIKAMLILGCISVRLWRQTDDALFLLVGMGALFMLATGLMLTSFTRRPEYGAKQPTEDGQPAEISARTGPIGLSISVVEHLARVVVHYPSHIWLWAAMDRIDIYFWAYAGVNTLYAGRMSLILLLRLGRFAPRPKPSPAGSEPS